MAFKMGLLGRKLGMTQVFHEDGTALGCTVLALGPCVVTGQRTPEKHGYSAVQLGFEAIPPRLVRRSEAGYAKKVGHGSDPARAARGPARARPTSAKFEVGKVLKAADVFKAGDVVDAVGVTKGKGYQGVIKRHKMGGVRRHPRYPRVLPPRRLDRLPPDPGPRAQGQAHDAATWATATTPRRTWWWCKVLEDKDVVLVKGAVPGAAQRPGPAQGQHQEREEVRRAARSRRGRVQEPDEGLEEGPAAEVRPGAGGRSDPAG